MLLTLETVDSPRVADDARLTCQDIGLGFQRVVARYGFMESPNVPALLLQASQACGKELYNPMSTSFYLGRTTLTVPSGRRLLRHTLLHIFLWLRRNELEATAHFGLPANRVVESRDGGTDRVPSQSLKSRSGQDNDAPLSGRARVNACGEIGRSAQRSCTGDSSARLNSLSETTIGFAWPKNTVRTGLQTQST